MYMRIINPAVQYKKRPPKNISKSPGSPERGPSTSDTRSAASFPTVGMTLKTYNHDPFDRLQASPSQRTHQAKFGRKIFSGITLKRIVVTLAILLLLIGGWVGGKFIYNTHKLFGGNIFGIFSTAKLKGEDVGRVNILLAGNSSDDPGHAGANLTDSILLLSINTKTNQAFMLSIPRDLWVYIPGTGYQKINDAYVAGEADSFSAPGYPNGGMGQLEQIMQKDFGIPIDYYALINYQAFKDAVNAVGGITINIQSSDPRGLYDPSIDYSTNGALVKLTNGVHTLNGEQALDFARARGDAYGSYGFPASDFDRTAHQRQMLVALKSKAESAGVLTSPTKLTSLFDAVGNNVKTDLTLSDAKRLYDLTKNIGSNSIQSVSLNSVNGTSLLANYAAPGGESALVPAAGVTDFSQIQLYLKQLTSNDPIVRENAKVVLLNATNSYGLASKVRTRLETKNINVTSVADAGTTQAATTIIDNSQGHKPATRQFLATTFGNSFTTTDPYGSAYQADFIVVLGADQAASSNN
jgi:LCP family protein required for cell wall assembly